MKQCYFVVKCNKLIGYPINLTHVKFNCSVSFLIYDSVFQYFIRNKMKNSTMASDLLQDKLSIKNLLFTKAMPSLTPPIPTEGYKTYPCIDCGDRFLLLSSYENHINRKSLTITYRCQHCHETKIFNNRCKLLSHIRAHAFKSATINVSDLKIEPLPQQEFNSLNEEAENQFIDQHGNTCYECKKVIEAQGQIHRARAKHYMQYSTDPLYTCPICLFTVPTTCGLIAHMRIHLKIPPYYCPECGFHLPNRSISYPYSHDCDGFKMMRVTARSKCPFENCATIFHPNEYHTHVKSHYKREFKCQKCSKIFTQPKKHTTCPNGNDFIDWYQCPLCTEKVSLHKQIDKHLNNHLSKDQVKEVVFQCHICKLVFGQMHFLLHHHIIKHGAVAIKNILSKIIKGDMFKSKKNGVYRVVKRCDKCLVSFTYRCQYETIKTLPNECPYRCSTLSKSMTTNCPQLEGATSEKFIICFMCKNKIKEDWNTIKRHYALFHGTYKCLDLKLQLTKIDNKMSCFAKNKSTNRIKKKIQKKKTRRSKSQLIYYPKVESDAIIDTNIETKKSTDFICKICDCSNENQQQLETHVLTHRDPYMAYQCLECGQCFAVKPSFSTHLLLEHDISDFQEYINTKQCYNELALQKNQRRSIDSVEQPVSENQCKICRDQFENSSDLEKHFRVHGMAFLMKTKNSNSP